MICRCWWTDSAPVPVPAPSLMPLMLFMAIDSTDCARFGCERPLGLCLAEQPCLNFIVACSFVCKCYAVLSSGPLKSHRTLLEFQSFYFHISCLIMLLVVSLYNLLVISEWKVFYSLFFSTHTQDCFINMRGIICPKNHYLLITSLLIIIYWLFTAERSVVFLMYFSGWFQINSMFKAAFEVCISLCLRLWSQG